MKNKSEDLVRLAQWQYLRWAATGLLLMLLALPAQNAYADISNFSGRVPRVGSVTFPQGYITTGGPAPRYEIRVRMSKNPYDLSVKAVRCDGRGDVSSDKRWIPANSDQLITVATNVRVGTCFKLNFDAPTVHYFDIAGRVSY